jgi:hypothetical protein
MIATKYSAVQKFWTEFYKTKTREEGTTFVCSK